MKLIMKTIAPVGRKHTATVIFFHGSGDTGHNLVEWVRFLLRKDMEFSHIKVMYPTAPVQRYTPLDGELSNVWFDRASISIDAKESRQSLESIYETANELIKNEIDEGIPASRIVVGGFSMGGALAMHIGYHVNTEIAGVFACSSFLNRGSIVYDSLANRKSPNSPLPELLMFHGDRDSLVPAEWGEETFNELKKLGVNGDFHLLKNAMHELKAKQMMQLQEWINRILPEYSSGVENKL
ncbi:unnamed protein product [Hermetia illucens]|uniref:palmitoyl-protein hydrolase n=2 Tax=Hermetia illucens TaxID=343691 RepID=A0A7R8UYS3_HERIL|nr:unnamed protein product [Hermetia illucens]